MSGIPPGLRALALLAMGAVYFYSRGNPAAQFVLPAVLALFAWDSYKQKKAYNESRGVASGGPPLLAVLSVILLLLTTINFLDDLLADACERQNAEAPGSKIEAGSCRARQLNSLAAVSAMRRP